ncbi:MAG: transglycosylase domain-containing protein [Terrimicrobiaceae bacterium]
MKFRTGLKRAAIFVAAPFVAGTIFLEWKIRHAPIPESLLHPSPTTPVLEDLRGRPFSSPSADFARDARPGRLKDFGPWLPAVTVAVEDRRFYRHRGVDLVSMAGASLRNLRSGRIISGASTITQQTVKLGTGRTRRTFDAKWREAFAAMRLDREWTKERILEAYLNRLDYGNRRVGPVAAAHAYFGKAPADLTFAEAVYVAGIPQSPSRLNPWRNPARALDRYRRNILRMSEQGLLPAGMTAEALLASPPTPGCFEPPSDAPHFAREALARLRPGDTGRRSTLDLDLQQVVRRIVESARKSLEPLGASACGAVVVDNASGGVRAMVSSSPPQQKDVNATMTPRSAGSTLKPFLYTAAIERRVVTAATLLPDTEEAIRGTYPDYDPQNYNRRFLGPVRVREALGNSLNVPAVVTLGKLGARETFGKLGAWGFRFRGDFDSYGAGFILGNAEISLLDLAGAFASLARGGEAWRATMLVGEPVEPVRCASGAASAIVADILCDNGSRRLSFGDNSPLNVGVRVAVKTGTSSGFRDGWCVGFTKEHTVAVWAGNPDGSPMNAALAVHSAAPVWNAITQYLLAEGDSPLPSPSESLGLEKREIARETGLLPREGEPVLQEWFLPGTAPTASSSTMHEDRGGREVLLLPAEYAGWCAGPQNRIGAVARTGDFQILFPKDGSVFVLNPNLPKNQQILVPKCTDPSCEWFANGEKIETGRFRLQPGEWTLTARSGPRERSAKIRVE